jgi:hypothetical protein
MLSVANKPFKLKVVILIVVMLNVAAPQKGHRQTQVNRTKPGLYLSATIIK